MKIIRYQDASGEIHYGKLLADNTVLELSGELLTGLAPTERTVKPHKLLAPIVPASLLCVGLNYRRHAEETGAKIP